MGKGVEMAYLIILFLDDTDKLPDILDAWHAAGVPGATILQSTGAHRTRNWLSQVGLGTLDRLFDTEQIRRRTLLAAIDDETLKDKAIGEAERVMGGFDRPNSGLLLVLPLLQVIGMQKRSPAAAHETLPDAVYPEWYINRQTSVEEVLKILDLKPTIVQSDTPLDQVAVAMLAHPRTHIACVVNEDERLVGIIGLRSIADDLFFHIMPEEFMSDVRDLESAMEFADRSRMRTAADAMRPPEWVKREELVKDAFERMHDKRLSGLPVVDDRYRVVGYINLFELMAACLNQESATSDGDDEV